MVQRADEAVQTGKAVASGQRGEIHVGCAPSLTVELLPRALRFFQEANPGVRVQLHDLSTQEMLRGLRDGNLHVALLVYDFASQAGRLTISASQSMTRLCPRKVRQPRCCTASQPFERTEERACAGDRQVSPDGGASMPEAQGTCECVTVRSAATGSRETGRTIKEISCSVAAPQREARFDLQSGFNRSPHGNKITSRHRSEKGEDPAQARGRGRPGRQAVQYKNFSEQ